MIRHLKLWSEVMRHISLRINTIALHKVIFVFALLPLKILSNEFTQEQEIRVMQYLDGVIQSQIDNEQREITFSDKPIPKTFCEEGVVSRTHERNALSNFVNSIALGIGTTKNATNKDFPTSFFSLDVGYLGLPSECANRKIFLGGKVRYEQAIEIKPPFDSVYRLGVEGYYHPQLLNFKGHQIASLSLGFGYRFKHTNLVGGNYVDLGVLLYPSFPVYFALIYRTDYASDTPTQHSLRLLVKIPILVRL